MFTSQHHARLPLLVLVLTFLASCGGSGGGSSPTVATVSVSPGTSTLTVGDTQQLTATAKDSGGTTISSATFSYSSSDASVATVSTTGLVTAVAAGTATITVTSSGKTGTSAITVNPGTVTISGSVYAPGGALTKRDDPGLFERLVAGIVPRAYAQTDGLMPVSGANVLIFKINDDGTPNGGVIVSGTTNTDGTFSLELPDTNSFASNLIIQASATNTPQAVGPSGQGTQSCPVAQASLPPITPAVEYATRTLINEIATNGATLSDYTVDEVKAIVKQAISLASDASLVGANLEDTIANIANVEGPQIQEIIDSTKSSGEASPPDGLGGTYNVIGIQADTMSYSEQRAQEFGTVTIDASALTFNVDTTSNSARLDETCNATQNDRCARTFTRTVDSQANSTSGSIAILGGNRIGFQPSNGDGAVVGSYNSTGDIIILPAQDELIVAIKQTSAAPTFDGTFQAAEIDSNLQDSTTISVNNNTWSLGTTSSNIDTITVSGTTFTGDSTEYRMLKTVTCGITCPDSEALGSTSSSNSISGGVAVAANGVLTISPNGQSNSLSGAITSGANFFALSTGNPTDGDAGMTLGVSQGSGMSVASLTGAYSFASIELDLGTSNNSVRTEGGAITLGGDGTGSGSLTGIETDVNYTCSSTACSNETQTRKGVSDSPQFTYTVSATGAVSITADQGTTIGGFASPDGSIIVLNQRQDGSIGGSDSSRGLFILVK